MDFFKSVFADDPDPPEPQPESDSPKSEDSARDSPHNQPDPNPSLTPTGWSFGGLMKTIATRSESVIETYRRDLQEFGSGLKKEIEVAQGSLENVGHAIDEFGNSVLKGTAQIINQGRDAILAAENESDSSSSESNSKLLSTQRSLNSKGYSRFDAQMRAIQGDFNTYSEEPEDMEDYKKWKSGFGLDDEKKEEIERLMEENGEIGSAYKRVVGVPNGVDHETFWCRYFYKVYKLKQAEDMRVKLVKRAISREEEEELSWDVDDDDDEEEEEEEEDVNERNMESNVTSKEEEVGTKEKDEIVESRGYFSENKEQVGKEKEKEKNPGEELRVESYDSDKERKGSADESIGGNVGTEKVNSVEKGGGACKEDSVSKSAEKVASEGKGDDGESSNGNGKDSDFSVVSSHPSMPEAEEEEDLGWDEIEDLSSIDDKNIDDKKGSHGGSPSSNRADLRKRSSTAEEDEDLSWDIEDDDEPVKA